MSGRGKRIPALPQIALDLGDRVSKADLLEVAWEMAALSNAVSCDDDVATLRRLVELLDGGRTRRGEPPRILPRRLRKLLDGGTA